MLTLVCNFDERESMALTRRQFLRRTLTLGLGAAGTGTILSLGACGPQPAPETISAAPAMQPTRAAAPGASPSPAALRQTPGQAPTSTPLPAETATTAAAAPSAAPPATQAYLAAVHGLDPAAMVERALAALGGIERFCRPGYTVIVKPNICNAYHGPEYASTTNPDVVAALVRLCLGAGAKQVQVLDSPFGGTAKQAYKTSGIQAAVEAAGGEMVIMPGMKFRDTPIPQGKSIQEWPAYRDAIEVDLLINVPIAKHHGTTRLTLAGKNLMGLVDNRGEIHRAIGQRVADLGTLFRPALTVVDAVRILMDNGPTGGDLADVKQTNLVIASHDMVAADTYATRLFDVDPLKVPYIKPMAEHGLGTMDLASVKVEELNV
jgi:uncharacterized protein (DUF362 family)